MRQEGLPSGQNAVTLYSQGERLHHPDFSLLCLIVLDILDPDRDDSQNIGRKIHREAECYRRSKSGASDDGARETKGVKQRDCIGYILGPSVARRVATSRSAIAAHIGKYYRIFVRDCLDQGQEHCVIGSATVA